MKACRASRSPLLLPAFVVALNTGLRYSELRLLRWSQIDFLKAHVTVGQSKTAAWTGVGSSHSILVCPQRATAMGHRGARPATKPLRLPGGENRARRVYARDPDRPIGSWKTAWARAKNRAGVTARFHDIRHTACTRMLEGGHGLSVVATILGWSAATTAVMAKRYGHIGDTARRAAVAVLDASAWKSTEGGGTNKGYSQHSSESADRVSS